MQHDGDKSHCSFEENTSEKVQAAFCLIPSRFDSLLLLQHPKMTLMMKSCFLSLTILFLWRVEDGAEACTCAPTHPQKIFCQSDVVFRARVLGRQEIDIGHMIKKVKYDVKVTEVFKNLTWNIDAVYTPYYSATCGVTLDTVGGKEYLITGKLGEDGNVQISECGFNVLWDDLSATQRLNLAQCYEKGCGCTITPCLSLPCMISSTTECLWSDMVTGNTAQYKKYACLKRRDGSCSWYRGCAAPRLFR